MSRRAAALWLASMSFAAASPAAAQDLFAGGSLLFWRLDEATPIPRATSGLHGIRVDAGPLEPTRPGVMFQGGVFLSRRLILGGELAFRASRATTVEERSQFHTTTEQVTWQYTDGERLVSVLVGTPWSTRSRRTEVQLLGGLTFRTLRQSVADRSGVYYYPGGQMPVEGPGPARQFTRIGFGGGGDVLVRLNRHLAAVTTIRLHLLGTSDESNPPPGSGAPPPQLGGGSAIFFGGGLRWERGR